MIPKKAKTLYKSVSEDLDLSLDLVEDFVEFYYKNVRQKMSKLENIRYDLEGLGHVYIRKNLVKNKNNLIYVQLAEHYILDQSFVLILVILRD